jgi:hypothetical protein
VKFCGALTIRLGVTRNGVCVGNTAFCAIISIRIAGRHRARFTSPPAPRGLREVDDGFIKSSGLVGMPDSEHEQFGGAILLNLDVSILRSRVKDRVRVIACAWRALGLDDCSVLPNNPRSVARAFQIQVLNEINALTFVCGVWGIAAPRRRAHPKPRWCVSDPSPVRDCLLPQGVVSTHRNVKVLIRLTRRGGKLIVAVDVRVVVGVETKLFGHAWRARSSATRSLYTTLPV